MRVVVVGAGLASMAAAARMAKLGHQVRVFERSQRPGGRFAPVERDGFRWDGDVSALTLPATLRDLFRKSGRQIERVLDLSLRPVARRHVFADGSAVDLPTGSRGAQIAAIDAGLGPGTGQAWTAHVDGQAAVWDLLRRTVLDASDASRLGQRRIPAELGGAISLAQALTADLHDRRLLTMAGWPTVRAGLDPRQAPAYLAVAGYIDRTFGAWDVAGGNAAMVAALVGRLEERRVELQCSARVTRICVERGRATGVVLDDGSFVATDVVVSGLDAAATAALLGAVGRSGRPRLRRSTGASVPVTVPSTTHLGLRNDPSDREVARELVLHGQPTVVVTTGASAPRGAVAWTVRCYPAVDPPAAADDDPLDLLAQRGLDVRDRVVARIDRSPETIRAETESASYGLVWPDLRAFRPHILAAPALTASIRSLHLVGPSGHPATVFAAAETAYGLWSAAHVAELVGKA